MRLLSSVTAGVVAIAVAPGVSWSAATDLIVNRLDNQHLEISWTDANPVDVYWVASADADLSKGTLLSEGNRDGRYLASLAANRRYYILLRDRADQSVVRVSERLLPLERGSN